MIEERKDVEGYENLYEMLGKARVGCNGRRNKS